VAEENESKKEPRPDPGRGFFLRVLVVGAGILLIAAVYRVVYVRPPRPYSYTSSTIKNLAVALRQYDFIFGVYPPDASMDPRFDMPSECLVYYLGTAFRTLPRPGTGDVSSTKNGGPFYEFHDDYLRDADGDGKKEVIDYWGRPIMYDNLRDDPRGFTDCSHPKWGPDPRGGTGKNPNSYDIWSQGKTRPYGNFKPNPKEP
jgi:hypothetical protein